MRIISYRVVVLVAALGPLAALGATASKASACPFCDGGPSGVNEVRAGVFEENFWPRVAATLAPFPVLVGIVALIYYGPPRVGRAQRPATNPPGPPRTD